MTDGSPTLILACGALAREIGAVIAANMRAKILIGVAILAGAGATQAQTPPDRGYDYLAICTLAELVGGYTLPPTDARLFHDRRVRRLPDTPNSTWFQENIAFSGDGVKGTVFRDRRTGEAFFHDFQVEARRVPTKLRSRSYLLSVLGVHDLKNTMPDMEFGCERWSVSLHFAGDALVSIGFYDSYLAYD
jgi:hypothetical protein